MKESNNLQFFLFGRNHLTAFVRKTEQDEQSYITLEEIIGPPKFPNQTERKR